MYSQEETSKVCILLIPKLRPEHPATYNCLCRTSKLIVLLILNYTFFGNGCIPAPEEKNPANLCCIELWLFLACVKTICILYPPDT